MRKMSINLMIPTSLYLKFFFKKCVIYKILRTGIKSVTYFLLLDVLCKHFCTLSLKSVFKIYKFNCPTADVLQILLYPFNLFWELTGNY